MLVKIKSLLPKGSVGWKITHHLSKPILLNSVGYLSAMLEDVIREKKEKGWVNPEIGILYSNFTEMIEKDYPIMEVEDGKYDHIRRFYCGVRDILCAILDEDSHYFLRFLYMLEILHRDYDLYRIEMHKEKVYWDWEIIIKGLMDDDPAWTGKVRPEMKEIAERIKNAKKMVSE